MKGNRHSSVTPILLVLLVLFGGFGAVRASAQSYVFNANAFATGKSPEAVVTGDFNGDGQPDVAVANQGANTVSILLGNADATFKGHVDYAVGSNPIGIVAADFNGDGKLDLAVVNSSSNSVSVLIGNGDGTFQNQAVNSVGVNPQSIAAGGFNGDGNMDLVVANFNDNTVSVLLGNGDGTFQAQVTYQTGTGPTSVAIADFNADGNLDLVTADKSINSVSVLLGNGDGTFQAQAEYATGRNPVQVVVGDFNNDGKPDVAAADGGDGNVSILINSGNSTKLFPTVTTPAVYTLCTSLVVGDFNGDHNLDLAVSSAKSNTVAILLGQGNGQFQTFVPYSTGGLSGGSPNPVAAADINGDGHLDLVFANPLDSDISVLLNNGSGGFSSTVTSAAVAQFPISIAVADFDGDGILDVASVAYSATSASSVSVLLGKGDGTFNGAANYPTGNALDTDPEFVAAGDFNGDGYPDLAIANFGYNTVSILLNNGDGTFPTSGTTIPTYATGIGPTSVAVGDFNGDGILDLAVANSTDGTVSILLGNGIGGKGNGTFGIQKAYSASGVIGAPSPSWIVAADVHDKIGSGNGVLDLVVADTLTPLAPGGKNTGVDAVSVLLGNGDGSFKTATQYSTGTNTAPSSVVVGDFNGDGMPDIASANSGTGSVSVLLNIGSGAFGSATSYAAGQEAVGIAAADLNGSGNLDLIAGTTASFTNTISTLLGNGDGTFQIHVDHATGLSQAPDRRLPVVVGDFNGDGNLDVAVADEQTNVVEVYLNQPAIAFSPGTLTFGSVAVGSSSTSCGQTAACAVTISNTGTTPITLTSIVASGDFTQTNTCPSSSTSFAQGTNCTVSVTFTPAASGSRTGSLTVTDSVAGSPQALPLSGTGVAPAVALAPASLTFAAQNVGTTSAAQTVTLTNNGSGALAITSITPSPQFGQTNTCGSSVAQGASCTISVTFTPTAAGSQTGTITITDNASGSPQKVTLTGTGNGPAASLSPTTVNFGSQPVGSTSTAQVVTLTNTGNQNLSVTKITTAAPFGQTNNCTNVAANSSCTINVTFSPTSSVTSSGTVTITDNATGSPQMVTLSGTGGTGPFATLSPASVTFTTTNVGSSSSQTATLSNTGNASLSITGIAVSGANSSDFTESSTCGSTLAAGASCGITVTFKPAAGGNRTASLTVTDNSNNVAGSTQSVGLTGTGNSSPEAAVSPTSLDFGSQAIGTPATKTVTLTNSGNSALAVASIAVTGNSSYTQTSNCGTSVSAGKSCTITVTFSPSAGGTLSGTMTVTDNNNNVAGSIQTVSLTGSGTGPFAQLAPTSLSFAGVLVSSKSSPQTVSLSNGGTSALTISSSTIAITGAATTQFTQTNNCPASLAVGSNCAITVTFAPTTGGTQNADLSISGVASNGPVALSGAGSNFTLSPPTNSSQTVAAGSAATYMITLSPTGGFHQSVSLTCSTTAPAGSCSVAPNSLTINAPNTATATVTVTTLAAVPPPSRTPSGPQPRPWRSVWFCLWMAVLASLALGTKVLGRRRQITWRTCLLAGALSVVLAWAACGGSGSSTSTPTSTAAGTYSVTVTASSAGVPNSTTTLTLIVQ